MKHLHSRIAELSHKRKSLSQNGHLRIETCLSGNQHEPVDSRINSALLAASDEEKHGIFRDLMAL